ncbi:MAG: zinc/manganese transporter substrate binding protein [Rickettsiaceae bacterium]|jgi:zinc transport system substrate-binding protein|nr:zinc/manganese transporter substrate binding protein [Rickettsiaceae bacterium]
MHKSFNILLITIILNFSLAVNAEPKIKIVTMLSPIASLISMIGKDKVDIEILGTSNACVHHHHLKPSQINKLQLADLIIMVDPNFDGKVITKLNFPSNKVKYIAQSLEKIGNHDYHFWFDLHKVINSLDIITRSLSQASPQNQDYFKANYYNAKIKLLKLRQEIQKSLVLSNILLLSKALDSFFQNYDTSPTSYFISEPSIKFSDMKELMRAVKTKKYKCIIMDEEQSYEKFNNLFKEEIRIIQLNAEHWPTTSTKELSELYFDHFKSIMLKIKECN